MAFLTPIDVNRGPDRRSPGLRPPDRHSVSPFAPLLPGLNAARRVLSGEDLAEFDALAAAYCRQHRPETPAETYFTVSLVLCDWRRRRYAQVEAAILNSLPERANRRIPERARLAGFPRAFVALSQANDRAYRSALKTLRDLQSSRPTPPPPDRDAEPAALPRPRRRSASTARPERTQSKPLPHAAEPAALLRTGRPIPLHSPP